MKKVLRKTVSIALIACMLLVAVPMLASAAGIPDVSTAKLTISGGTVTVAGNAGVADEMLAITVVECDHNPVLTNGQGVCDQCLLTDPTIATKIRFMDDTMTAADGTYSFEVTALPDGTYTAFIGGTNVPVANQKKITFSKSAKQIKYGDLDKSGSLKNNDLVILVQYILGITSLDNDMILAADVDGSTMIKNSDVVTLAQCLGGVITDKQLGSDHNSEFVSSGAKVYDANNNLIASF